MPSRQARGPARGPAALYLERQKAVPVRGPCCGRQRRRTRPHTLAAKLSGGAGRGRRMRTTRVRGGPVGSPGRIGRRLRDWYSRSRCSRLRRCRRRGGWCGRRRHRRGGGGRGWGHRLVFFSGRLERRCAALVRLQYQQGDDEAEQAGYRKDRHARDPRVARHIQRVVVMAGHEAARMKTTPGGPAAEQACQGRKPGLAGVAGPKRKFLGRLVSDGFRYAAHRLSAGSRRHAGRWRLARSRRQTHHRAGIGWRINMDGTADRGAGRSRRGRTLGIRGRRLVAAGEAKSGLAA